MGAGGRSEPYDMKHSICFPLLIAKVRNKLCDKLYVPKHEYMNYKTACTRMSNCRIQDKICKYPEVEKSRHEHECGGSGFQHKTP